MNAATLIIKPLAACGRKSLDAVDRLPVVVGKILKAEI
jgi:hypothetical protein